MNQQQEQQRPVTFGQSVGLGSGAVWIASAFLAMVGGDYDAATFCLVAGWFCLWLVERRRAVSR